MAKVIQPFKERFHNFKLYEIDDDYPEEDKERVRYLMNQGYLSVDVEIGETGAPQTRSRRRKRGVTNDDSDA